MQNNIEKDKNVIGIGAAVGPIIKVKDRSICEVLNHEWLKDEYNCKNMWQWRLGCYHFERMHN